MSSPADDVRERGFTKLDALIPASRTAVFASRLHGEWLRLGAPAIFSDDDVWLEPGIHVSPVGLTRARILSVVPELSELLLRPELIALFEDLLGPGFELEYAAGVISDRTRPFFFWHHHVGGIDAEDARHLPYPRYDRAERLACTLYASPLDAAHGRMLVWPRRIDASTAPPYRPAREPWPGADDVVAPIGSVVVLDQGTWHAVTPMSLDVQRFFFGFFVRRRGLPPTKRSDPTLPAVFANDPALARVYGGGPCGG